MEDREEDKSGTQAELPKYKCHKVVHAAKITEIESHESDGTGSHTMIFGGLGMSKFMGDKWKDKHSPKVGGYYVVYEDNYTSYSPAEVFELGYSRM